MRALPSRLLGIADAQTLGESLIDKVVEAAEGGVRWICLRAKELSSTGREKIAREIITRCSTVALTIHSDPELAARLGVAGVHFGSKDPRVAESRRAYPELFVGASCHDAQEVDRAQRDGADYGWLSPFNAPLSKIDDREPLGVAGFSEIANNAEMPLFALGGVRAGGIGKVASAGCYGVALIGGLFLSGDARVAGARLVNEIEKHF